MQLELFDIRSNAAPQKGKSAVSDGSNVHKAAAGETSTDKGARNDFRSSLALVSKENQAAPGDIPTKAALPHQMPDGDDLAVLNAMLRVIVKEWPAGKRPVLLAGAGSEGHASKRPGPGTRASGPGSEMRMSRARVLPEAGKERQAMVAWQGTVVGFTSGLIKPRNSAPKPDSEQLRTENKVKATAGAIHQNAVPAGMARLSKISGGQGAGTGFFKMEAVGPVAGNATPVKGDATQGSKGNGPGPEKDPGERGGQSADALKTFPQRAGIQARRVRPAGKNAATGIEKKAAEKFAAHVTRKAAKEGDRVARDTFPEKKAAGQGLSTGEKVSADLAKATASATLSQKGLKEVAAGSKPKSAPHNPVGDRHPEPATATAKQAVSGLQGSLNAGIPGQGQGLAQKSAWLQNTTDRRDPESLRNLTTAKGEKSAAAVERKRLLNGDTSTGGKENSSTDHPAGQAVRDLTRDLKGLEQPRFETAAAKVKPVENAHATPNGHPGPAVSATLESAKPPLDRALQARVLEQIADKVRLSPKKGGHEIKIHLRPESLGQVQLKVLTQDHRVTVKMIAETHVAREIIENNLGQLRADLNTLGLNVETLDVDVFTANDPGERDPGEHRDSLNPTGTDTGEHAQGDGDLIDRVRQMHAAEDAADGGTLIGVFA